MLALAVTTDAETTERMTGPLAERGIDVQYLPTTGRAIALSASDPRAVFDDAPSGNRTGAASGERSGFDVGFVYPSRLAEGGVIDALLDCPWVNDREAITTSRNKAGVLAALARAEVPVPETVLVSNPTDEDDLLAVFDRFSGSVVVKPNSATRGIGVTKITDRDSFLGVCDYLGLIHDFPATGDKSFLVQEFLPDARDYRVMVVDGEPVGAVERRGAGWKHNVHRGARAVGVPVPDDLAALAERVAAVLEIPYLGVDLLATEERIVVTETNARPTIDDASKYRDDFYDALAALIHATGR